VAQVTASRTPATAMLWALVVRLTARAMDSPREAVRSARWATRTPSSWPTSSRAHPEPPPDTLVVLLGSGDGAGLMVGLASPA
jgi:hypothetical protein